MRIAYFGDFTLRTQSGWSLAASLS